LSTKRHPFRSLGNDVTCEGVSRQQFLISKVYVDKSGIDFKCCAHTNNNIGIIPYRFNTDSPSGQKRQIQLHASNDQNGLFYDHASRFLHFTPHHSTGAEEAIVAKRHFEHLASTHNRTIKRYHADNGVFTTKLFRDACQAQNQNLTFCGVDAHHQNGITERFIRTITERARTMLIHAMLRLPDIITEDLWPFAVQMAVDLHNMTPTTTGLSPQEMWNQVQF
jgi:hypothetical protein